MQAADLVLQTVAMGRVAAVAHRGLGLGKPIVASDIRGNRDVVGSEAGILCAPQDESAYAVELARLIQCPRLRHDLGTAGRRRAQALFDADVKTLAWRPFMNRCSVSGVIGTTSGVTL